MRGLWLMALGVPIVAPACARVGEAHAPAAAMVAPATDVRLPAPLPGGSEDVWLSQVVYLVMPDRFQDGDPTNDEAGTPHCYDPSDPSKWHGGDIAGLRQRIPYLQELGVTAVWITPQYRQSPDRCGYHGYWADFASPDDGAVEPKMGTPAELAGLANDLHAAGIRLVLDMVVNHAGPAARVVAEQPTWFHDPATCKSLRDPVVY